MGKSGLYVSCSGVSSGTVEIRSCRVLTEYLSLWNPSAKDRTPEERTQ